MKQKKRIAWAVDLSATVFIAWAALATLADFISRYRFSYPFDLGVVLGNAAMAAAGLVAAAVTRSLRNMEERLQRLEDLQSRPQGRPPREQA